MITIVIDVSCHRVMSTLVLLVFMLTLLTGCDSGAIDASRIAISPENGTTLIDDFSENHAVWHEFEGKWLFTAGVIRQTSTRDSFPLVLRMGQQFSDLDISVDFKPLSGRIDASGGLVFRAVDKDNYYIVRANSLENNFRLYTFKKGKRSQIASAEVSLPTLGEFHQIRVVAKGNYIQAYLNGRLLIDHHDNSFAKGFIGLWTKADSVTEFDHLHIVGVDE